MVNEEACLSNYRGAYSRDYCWLCGPAAAGRDEGVISAQQAKIGKGVG
jgi:hypothetical protein